MTNERFGALVGAVFGLIYALAIRIVGIAAVVGLLGTLFARRNDTVAPGRPPDRGVLGRGYWIVVHAEVIA